MTTFDLTELCLVQGLLTQYCTRKITGKCFNEAHLGVSILLGFGNAHFRSADRNWSRLSHIFK